MKKYNFNAGPSMLPREVIEATAAACLDFDGNGLSLMEISHRAKYFQPVVDEAVALTKELLDIPEGYEVIFLAGGASTEFCRVPYNFLEKKAAYLNTGVWSKKAMKEAQLFGETVEVASSADTNYNYIPKGFDIPEDLDYLYICANNTIYGTEYKNDIDSSVPLIADMSSNILSRPIDVSKYAMIYGGAQKNVGPAGATIVIIREDLIGHADDSIPTYLDYKVHAENDSMYNTPPCYAIYVAGLVFKWVLELGGLEKMKEMNEKKANLLYDYLDSQDYYFAPVKKDSRSMMNVTFVTGVEELDKKFPKEAEKVGLMNLKGHRSVGGMRASIYNAMPYEGVEALVEFMKEFAKNNPK